MLSRKKREGSKMRRWSMFCLVLIIFGFLDLLTSVVGIACFGAAEKNPVLASFTGTNMVAFSVLKLAAIASIGFLFYKAGNVQGAGRKIRIEINVLRLAYSLSLFTLVTVVTNNVVVVAKLV